jgi:prohibitin 2
MRNPFKRSSTPEYTTGSRSGLSFNKLKIVAGIITFVVIIVFMFESVVVVEAGHRGVVLYVGAVENRVLGEGIHFIIPFAEQVVPLEVRTLKFQAPRLFRDASTLLSQICDFDLSILDTSNNRVLAGT